MSFHAYNWVNSLRHLGKLTLDNELIDPGHEEQRKATAAKFHLKNYDKIVTSLLKVVFD